LRFGCFDRADKAALRPLLYAAALVGFDVRLFSDKGQAWREQAFFIQYSLPPAPNRWDGATVLDCVRRAPAILSTLTPEAVQAATRCVRDFIRAETEQPIR